MDTKEIKKLINKSLNIAYFEGCNSTNSKEFDGICETQYKKIIEAMEEYHKSKSLSEHSNKVELLVKYSEWLEKECFLDSDWRQEARTVDEYLKTLKK